MEQNINKDLALNKPQEIGFILAKSQKLVTALYLITGFFSDNEPSKWKLRDLGSRLISTGEFLKDNFTKPNKEILEIHSIVHEIVSFLAILKQAGLVSEMNYSILNQEFSTFLTLVSLPEEFEKGSINHIRKDFFITEEKAPREPQETIRAATLTPRIQSTQAYIKDKNVENLKDFSVVAVKKNSRQSIIINLLKRKKEIMIKDVSSLIDGCSEKTIQRELLAMVQSGVLHKTGEKRWSKYSIAKP